MKHTLQLILLFLLPLSISAQCFDMSTLYSSNITCTYGYYDDPYAYIGVRNGRHTVMANTNEYDLVAYQLRTIPQGEKYAVRLGNSNTNAEAESITYEYIVDATNPILLLKYAAVMEDPGHEIWEQPRLRLEVMDANGTLINPECTSFDFVASQDLGWNSLDGGKVLWKDWTNIGVDLSAYIGNTVRIRLTTYDCKQSGHFGYAYIHLSCTQKEIKSLVCGDATTGSFSAPSGFNYQWYTKEGGQKKNLGTNQTETLPIDGKTYYCDVSQVGKSSCSFTSSITSNPRYPIADFAIKHSKNCIDTIYLTNKSGVSTDGITLNTPLEKCDYAQWDLGDGRTLTNYNPSTTPIVYDKQGTYTIRLIVTLKDGGCTDTISKTVTVHGKNDKHEAHLYESICDGATYVFHGQVLTKTGVYTHTSQTAYGCDSITTLHLTVLNTARKTISAGICEGESFVFKGQKINKEGIYMDTAVSSNGCDSITTLHLGVHPKYFFYDTVSICDKETYYFHGQFITEAGVYKSKYKSIYGCDSIYQVVVKVNPTFYKEEVATICDNEVYDFHGQKLSTKGEYYARYTDINGCDSVYKLTLKVLPTYLIDQYVETCHADSFLFRGKMIYEPGIFYDSILTSHGCDSVFRFIYNRTPIFSFEEEKTILQGEVLNYHGKQLKDSGLHVVTLQTSSGCDSIYRLYLHVLPKHFFLDKDTICESELPYVWRGKNFHKTGIYHDSLRTTSGNDSVYELQLTVFPVSFTTSYVETCRNAPFIFKGDTITEPGIYLDTLVSFFGCDSIRRIIYNHAPSYLVEDTMYVCNGTTIHFHGQTITHPGTYYDTQTTVSGCDSSTILHVIGYDDFKSVQNVTICTKDSFIWRGKVCRDPGSYYDTYSTINGCDSVYILNLSVYPTYDNFKLIKLCPNETFTFKGKEYKAPYSFIDSVQTINGCDSITHYTLIVDADYIIDRNVAICPGEYYNFRGQYITKKGTYLDTLYTNNGCDSIIRLNLSYYPTYELREKDSVVCSNQPYRWRGKEYFKSGTYYDSLKTTCGCDSVISLELSVHNTYLFTTRDTISDLYTYSYRNRTFTKQGTYYDSLQTTYGCDSIFELILTVQNTLRETELDTICIGDHVNFRGRDIYESGVYYDTICLGNHRDCKVQGLNLYVSEPNNVYYAEIDNICTEDKNYRLHFEYSGSRPLFYNLLYDENAKIQGFKDVVNRRFTDTIIDNVPGHHRSTYIKPDVYHVTLQLYNGICNQELTNTVVPFTINYPSWIMEQNWNDVVALLSKGYNGGYEFDAYEWYINNNRIYSANSPYMYTSLINPGDEVVVRLTRKGENYSIPSCPLTIVQNDWQYSTYPVLVYATQTPSKAPQLTIESKTTGNYQIYDLVGHLVLEGVLSQNETQVLNLPYNNGYYIIRLEPKDAETRTQKVTL